MCNNTFMQLNCAKDLFTKQKVSTIFINGRWIIVHLTVDTYGFTWICSIVWKGHKIKAK